MTKAALSEMLILSCFNIRFTQHLYTSLIELNPISCKEIFFFDDGSTVFWNVPHLERENVLHFLRGNDGDIEVEPFDRDTIGNTSFISKYYHQIVIN